MARPRKEAGEGEIQVNDEIVEETQPESDEVTVTVPHAFKLNIDHHLNAEYKAGVQQMPLSHAEHWWSKANGVEIYSPKKTSTQEK